jgi:predicted transcriptional regulator of viral defense system
VNAVRALETLRALERPIVRTAEAAAVLGISGSNASHLLASLQEAGSVMRIMPGRWSVSGQPSPYLVASWLTDPFPSYASLYTALSRRGLITQMPRTIYVVSLGRTKTVPTPIGTYSVHRLPPELFGGFEERDGERMATAEKAVFDSLYLARARGRRFSHLTEMELPADFRPGVLDDWAAKIGDRRVRSFVEARIAEFLARAGWPSTS